MRRLLVLALILCCCLAPARARAEDSAVESALDLLMDLQFGGRGVWATVEATDAYQAWRGDRVAELEAGASLIATAKGQVEYAMTGRGPVVLLAHGGGMGYDFIKIYQDIADRGYTLICPSRPGYLRTALEIGPSFEEQADVLAALLDALDVTEPVFILGASMGGPIALQFAIRHPHKTRGLIMQDAVSMAYAVTGEQSSTLVGLLMTGQDGIDAKAWLAYKAGRRYPTAAYAEFLKTTTTLDQAGVYRMAEEVMAQPGQVDKFREFIDMMTPMTLRRTGQNNGIVLAMDLPDYPMDRITAPTLVTHSTIDGDVVLTHGLNTAARIPGAELYTYRGVGHLFWFGPDWPPLVERTVAFLNAN